MAKLVELISLLSKETRLSEASVTVYARHLRQAQMLSSKGRGPGGADMTSRDCVALTLAIAYGGVATSAPNDVASIMSLSSYDISNIDDGSDPWKRHNFRNVMPNQVVFCKEMGLYLPHTFGDALSSYVEYWRRVIEGLPNGTPMYDRDRRFRRFRCSIDTSELTGRINYYQRGDNSTSIRYITRRRMELEDAISMEEDKDKQVKLEKEYLDLEGYSLIDRTIYIKPMLLAKLGRLLSGIPANFGMTPLYEQDE